MKRLFVLFPLASFLLFSCEGAKQPPDVTFNVPFEKNEVDLTALFGDTLALKLKDDTMTYHISRVGDQNLVTMYGGKDTLFYGTVSKFRGLYYFNQVCEDNTYHIHAVRLTNKLAYGFSPGAWQILIEDKLIRSGNYPGMLKYMDSTNILLHPEKKEMKRLFSAVLNEMPADTILYTGRSLAADSAAVTEIQPGTEEYEYFSKVYPNPVKDFLTIELNEAQEVSYQLTDNAGKIVLKGVFTESVNKLDLHKLADGLYILTLSNPEDKYRESLNVMKST